MNDGGMVWQKLGAFLWRDLINETSYKLSFVLQLFGIVVSSLTFFFLSRLMDGVDIPALRPYGGNYFAFIIIGQAFIGYLEISVYGLARAVRDGQMLGTLEALLLTRTEIPLILLGSSLYSFVWTSLSVLLYLGLGVGVFGLDLGQANLGAALLVLALTVAAFAGLGVLSASFILVYKKGDPISMIFVSLSRLFGGLYFPISVLPDSLQIIAHLLPVTYALEGMRLALLNGYSVTQLLPYLRDLGLFCLLILPLSLYVFRRAVLRAKRDGSLGQY